MPSLIFKLSGQTTEDPISLKWKMELNENATTHLAKKGDSNPHDHST